MLYYMERAFPKALQVVQPLRQFSWYHNCTALLCAFKGKPLGPKFNVWIIFNSCKTHWLTTLYKLVMILLICDQGCSIYENKVCTCMIEMCRFRLWRAVGSYESCPGLTYSRPPPRQWQTCVHHARHVRRRGLHRLPDR